MGPMKAYLIPIPSFITTSRSSTLNTLSVGMGHTTLIYRIIQFYHIYKNINELVADLLDDKSTLNAQAYMRSKLMPVTNF